MMTPAQPSPRDFTVRTSKPFDGELGCTISLRTASEYSLKQFFVSAQPVANVSTSFRFHQVLYLPGICPSRASLLGTLSSAL